MTSSIMTRTMTMPRIRFRDGLSAILLAASLLSAGLALAVDKPQYEIADFIRDDRFVNLKISPKGTYAAATVPRDGKTLLIVIKPGNNQPYGLVNFRESNTHVVDFWWANDERILFTVGEKAGGLEQPVSFGEIWGTNADGSKQGLIAGARSSATGAQARGKGSRQVALEMLDSLRDEEDFVLVSTTPFNAGEIPYTSVERMNVYTGVRQPVTRAPARGASFVSDQKGHIRFAAGVNREFKSVLYYRQNDKAQWELINDESASGIIIAPLDFSADDKFAYLQSQEKSGPDSIMEFDVATKQMQRVTRDDLVDPAGLIYAIGKRHPIGVMFMDGKPRFEYFNEKSRDAQIHKSLQQGFGGEFVIGGSFTDDGKQALLTSFSDKNPGEIFLYNTETGKATLLMSRADWFDRKRLGEMRPIVFSSRDGRKIEAFLTLPPGSNGKNLPLIVNPHGGPFGLKDEWGFALEPQLLAAHGYAVLQPNFRGSGGYGREFMEAGYKQWGGTMQDDLTDATLWAIKEGIADQGRICIYGGSYGGYASLMGVAKEPDLYRCAVGYVGVYDLNMLWGQGDISQRTSGKDFLNYAVGKDQLDAASPNKLVSRIKVPVFLAAGGADVRAPQSHSEAMEKALKNAGKYVESLYYPTEGHGFAKQENNREYYARLLSFFHRYLGGRAPAVAPMTGPGKK
jgi:dipeptidyl aminopeptidase/acylaminoacyl peptidase